MNEKSKTLIDHMKSSREHSSTYYSDMGEMNLHSIDQELFKIIAHM